MNYRKDKYGNELSALGYGCMRFPHKMGAVDMELTEKQIMTAIDSGVNYFDTAYIYPGSEETLGTILEKNNVRDKVKIATKLPHYLIKSRDALDRIFEEEKRRLRTDHVDYYLMHMLTDTATWDRLCELGVKEWLEAKKAAGEIGQIGFSYHGGSETFCALVDAYDWDFCMIQYNYMDEHSQAGRRGLHHAHKKGLPVMIMEPLRGGKLVSRLPEKAKHIFASYKKKYTPAEWSFRWLWDQKEVTVVLSGMNTLDIVNENVRSASSARIGEMSDADRAMLSRVVAAINEKMKVPCTGCGYCMPCPKGVDIPGTFAAYNRRYTEGKFWALAEYFMCTALRKNTAAASQCIGCGKCERHCPQNIEIRKHLKSAEKDFEGVIYKTAKKIAKKFTDF